MKFMQPFVKYPKNPKGLSLYERKLKWPEEIKKKGRKRNKKIKIIKTSRKGITNSRTMETSQNRLLRQIFTVGNPILALTTPKIYKLTRRISL